MRPCDKKFKMHFGYGLPYPPELAHITKDGRHHGYDYLTPEGTPILSPVKGVLTLKTTGPKIGNMIGVKFRKVEGLRVVQYRVLLMHLSQFKTTKAIGDAVNEGDLLGLSGDTGSAAGHPHLHLQMERYDGINWRDLDPAKVLKGLE